MSITLFYLLILMVRLILPLRPPRVYLWEYPVFDMVRYGGIQWDICDIVGCSGI